MGFVLIVEKTLTCSEVAAHGLCKGTRRVEGNLTRLVGANIVTVSQKCTTAVYICCNISYGSTGSTNVTVSLISSVGDAVSLTTLLLRYVDITSECLVSDHNLLYLKAGHHTFTLKDGFTFIIQRRGWSPTTTFEHQAF